MLPTQKIINIGELEIARLKNSTLFVKNFRAGIDLLKTSGLFEVMRIFARPVSSDGGRDVNMAAAEAHFVKGYNQCMDDIIYFEETFLADEKHPGTPRATYQGRKIALERGDITRNDIIKKNNGN